MLINELTIIFYHDVRGKPKTVFYGDKKQMAIITYETKEEIPSDLVADAKESEDGKFTVDVGLQSKIKEFRENNISGNQERDALKLEIEKFNGVLSEDQTLDDFLVELNALREVKKRVDDGEITEKDDIEKEVLNRMDAAKKQYEEQIALAKKEAKAAKEETLTAQDMFKNLTLDSVITREVTKPDSKMNPSALDDILVRAKRIYEVDANGKITPKKDGVILYGSDGETPLSVTEFMDNLLEEAPHLGKQSVGGGAAGSGGKGSTLAGGMTEKQLAELSPEERISYARKHGLT